MKTNLIRCVAVCLLFSCFFPLTTSAMRVSHRLSALAVLVAPEVHVDRLTAVERAAADAKSSGDNSWMLTSSALVLLMTGPGLALF